MSVNHTSEATTQQGPTKQREKKRQRARVKDSNLQPKSINGSEGCCEEPILGACCTASMSAFVRVMIGIGLQASARN